VCKKEQGKAQRKGNAKADTAYHIAGHQQSATMDYVDSMVASMMSMILQQKRHGRQDNHATWSMAWSMCFNGLELCVYGCFYGLDYVELLWSEPGKFQALRPCALSALELANVGRLCAAGSD
jgi:hypothetical protein